MNNNKVGLVLSGGGAKGAYEAGVVKYLSEINLRIDAIAGASIGSLNGAIIASSIDLTDAAEKLIKIWSNLWKDPPISFDNLNSDNAIKNQLLILSKVLGVDTLITNVSILKILFSSNDDFHLVHNDTEKKYIYDNIDFDKLINGIPFYASIYETQGILIDLLKCATQSTPSSEYIKIQNLKNKEDMIKLLLASSSIPIVFKPVEINGIKYRDGGLGGRYDVSGNTPVEPLVEKENCKTIIVVHLSDGSLWSRHKFKDCNIIEIRPQTMIKRNGNLMDMIAFNKGDIDSWIKQGYDDAKNILGKIKRQFDNISEIAKEQKKLQDKLDYLNNDGFFIK